MDVLFFIVGLAFLFWYIKSNSETKKPIKFAAINILSGVAVLTIASFITSFFSLKVLDVNIVTTFVSSVFGIPGALFLISKTLLF